MHTLPRMAQKLRRLLDVLDSLPKVSMATRWTASCRACKCVTVAHAFPWPKDRGRRARSTAARAARHAIP
eukprot:1855150-Amphidinium_carterae.1